MSKGGSDRGAEKNGGGGSFYGESMTEKPPPVYWSHRALCEDKKRCLTDMPHKDHTLANTLWTLHSGKEHLSNKGLEESKKGHKNLKNMAWRRQSEMPTHPYAKTKGINQDTRFFSQRDLADAKRKLKTNLHVTRYGESAPKTAREARLSGEKAGSRMGSMTSRSAMEEDLGPGPVAANKWRAGNMSPTMTELLEGGDEVHSVLSWWGTVRENRSGNVPHKSFQRFDIKKRHHTTGINEQEGSPVKGTGARSDPKGTAYQGAYPWGMSNHTFETPEHPASTCRYQSFADLTLDKGRHAHAESVDKRHLQRSMGGEITHPMEQEEYQDEGLHPPNFTGSKNQYRSNFTLQMHKKKHLAELHSQPLRYTTGPVTPGIAFTPDFKADNNGVKNEQSGGEISDRQLTSQREMAYCKRFNTVNLKKEGRPGWHPAAKKEVIESVRTPGARYGSDASQTGSRTPPHPAARADEPWVTSRQIGGDVAKMTRQLQTGRKRDSLVRESASDTELLHSSQQELAHRKSVCQTNIRHTPKSGWSGGSPSGGSPRGLLAVSSSSPALARFDDDRSIRSECFTPQRRDSHDSRAIKSNNQLEYSKRTHKFQHDDPRRRKTTPLAPPIPPTPRSGQWTPAHI
mmetsp:Transcript_80731/g.140119  ORF Transcript_80731/g.140119 Transcript_80731/m.140119 type:complete len:628 (+) Transcript_80731:102-1985(+)